MPGHNFLTLLFRLERDLSETRGELCDQQHEIEAQQRILLEVKSELDKMEKLKQEKDSEVHIRAPLLICIF